MQDLSTQELDFLASMFDLARTGDLTLAEYVDQGLPVNLTNGAGDTLLILAAYHQHPDLVDALVGRGGDHNRVNDCGQTALAAAVFRQSHEVVERLLAAGADSALGPQSALDIARFFQLTEMLALLTRSRPD
ncbi:MAG: ankyrin repeat domain-containing protein [Nocardioidaceae bacterium]